MDHCGSKEGHLIVFDRREGVSGKEKIFCREKKYQGQRIPVWGM
jgi:hypothetical protein